MRQSYKKMIERLGMSQVGAARFLGLSDRQSRRLVSGERELEPGNEMLLAIMLKYEISPDDACRIAGIRPAAGGFGDLRFRSDE